MQNITCEVAYIWLLSNRLRLNNDSAGSHIKEEGKLNMYTTRVRVWFRCSTEFVRSIGYDRFRRVGFRVLFIGFNMRHYVVIALLSAVSSTRMRPSLVFVIPCGSRSVFNKPSLRHSLFLIGDVFSICFVHTDMNVVFRANCRRNPLE